MPFGIRRHGALSSNSDSEAASRARYPALGRRIHILGNSCSGKSTLAAELAELLGVPLVELDALNWLPNWVALNATDPTRLEARIRDATRGDGWVLAGSYETFCRSVAWPRLDTIVWLDMPLWRLLPRVLLRSWRRWRTRELLWGTNYERFWPQLAIWRKEDSLIWWIVTQQRPKRRRMLSHMADPECAHIRFIRLRSPAEVREYLRHVHESISGDL